MPVGVISHNCPRITSAPAVPALLPYLLPAASLGCLEVVGAGGDCFPCRGWGRGKVCPPAQEFGKRGGVFQILMPTAPTRIKLSPALPVITPTYLASEALMFRNPAFGIKLRPASAWMKLSSCFYCHYFRVFTRRALFG